MHDIAAEKTIDFYSPQCFNSRRRRLRFQLQRAVDFIMIADRDQVQLLFPRQAQDRIDGFRRVKTGGAVDVQIGFHRSFLL